MTIQALIFDIGDVLFDASVWRRWLAARLESLGVDVTYGRLVERWEGLLVDVYRGRADYWQRFRELLQGFGLADEKLPPIERDARQKAIEVQVNRTTFEGVPETLAALQAGGIRLVALSDTESGEPQIREILRKLGIDRYFDAVVTSKDIGVCKPHPRAYQAAVAATGLAQDRCAFVGHDVDELEGARDVDLFSVAFNYHPAAPADAYIDRFTELKDVVLAP